MIRNSRRSLLLAALAAAPAAAQAQGQRPAASQSPQVQQPWARASAGNAANGAAYMTISNPAHDADRLVSAASPAARTVELHTHLMDNGVMRMRQVQAIEVNHGEPAVLRPGGLHVMLIGLNAPLREGTSFPLTLRFERGGETTVQVRVLGPAAMGPDGRGGSAPAHRH